MYYDYTKGWENTNKGWYEVVVENVNVDKHINMVAWLYSAIDKPETHARWIIVDVSKSAFKFRYERDYIMFVLRWL